MNIIDEADVPKGLNFKQFREFVQEAHKDDPTFKDLVFTKIASNCFIVTANQPSEPLLENGFAFYHTNGELNAVEFDDEG